MLRAVQKMKHNRENLLLADCRIALNDVKASQRRIELFKQNLIEKAKQSLEVSRTSFSGGTGDFLDMLDNIKLIIEMQLTVEKETLNKAGKVSELTMLFGNHLRFFSEE